MTASQGESYSVRYRQLIPEVVPTYTDRREAEIPHVFISGFGLHRIQSTPQYPLGLMPFDC